MTEIHALVIIEPTNVLSRPVIVTEDWVAISLGRLYFCNTFYAQTEMGRSSYCWPVTSLEPVSLVSTDEEPALSQEK